MIFLLLALVVLTVSPAQSIPLYHKCYPVSKHPLKLLRKTGHEIGFNQRTNNAEWVAYHVFKCVGNCHYGLPRPRSFRKDPSLNNGITTKDYVRSGYDRGHLAPNHAISTRYGRFAQKDTFLMSNIVPQKPNLNRGVWYQLEKRIARKWASEYQELWILTGSVYLDSKNPQYIKNKIRIPDAFFKIILDEKNNKPRLMAFLIPQTAKKSARIEEYLVSVDRIEELTGIDFFSCLDDSLENQIESTSQFFD